MLYREGVLIGYSGHGVVVADAAFASNMKLTHYLDKEQNFLNPFNLSYLGFEGNLENKFWDYDYDYILGIGNNLLRRNVANFIQNKGKTIISVSHPTSSISEKIELGIGNFISRNVSINALVKIGNFCILNTACIIEHECLIGNGVHIAPGAVLAGNVEIGDNTFIGANSVIKQGVKIGADVIVGAGSVILRDIKPNTVFAGNPGRKLV